MNTYEPTARHRCKGGSTVGVFYIHTDHLNAPSKITRPSDNAVIWRWDHDPFGNGTPNQDPDGNGLLLTMNMRFPGQYFDQETGLYYNYFRYYDPATGTFTTPDPIGLAGGSFSLYAALDGNPISNVDPFGLATKIKPPTRPKLTKDQCSMDCQALYQALIRACQATGPYFFACKIEVDQLVTECMINGKPPAPECNDKPQMACQKEED